MARVGKEPLVWQKGSIFCRFFWKNIRDGVYFITLVQSDTSQAGWIHDLPCVFEPNPIFLKVLAERGNRYSMQTLLRSVTALNFFVASAIRRPNMSSVQLKEMK